MIYIKSHYFLEFEKMTKFELFKTKYLSTVSSFNFRPQRGLYMNVYIPWRSTESLWPLSNPHIPWRSIESLWPLSSLSCFLWTSLNFLDDDFFYFYFSFRFIQLRIERQWKSTIVFIVIFHIPLWQKIAMIFYY